MLDINFEDAILWAFHSEIEGLSIPAALREEPDPVKRRNLITDWIEGEGGKLSATSLVVEEEWMRVLILEIVRRYEVVEGRIQTAERPLAIDTPVRLATVTGRPLAARSGVGDPHLRGVKIGQRPLDSQQCRELERRGGDPNILRDFGAIIDCKDLVDAHTLLSRFGWRLNHDRKNWLLYEVGGPLEEELAWSLAEHADELNRPELELRAKEIAPYIFDDFVPPPEEPKLEPEKKKPRKRRARKAPKAGGE